MRVKEDPMKIARAAAGLILMLGGAALPALSASAETVKMRADLKGSNQTPPNQTGGTGMINATFDTSSRMLTWQGTYSGLTGPATAAHFHGPAEPGKNAGIVVPSPAASPIQGSATLNETQAADLIGGKYYFNVHTAANPGGEIRGQVVKAP
jgi:hypothetical protein